MFHKSKILKQIAGSTIIRRYKDGLPFIGKHPDYQALTSTWIRIKWDALLFNRAKLISQDVAGKNPKELEIFKFNRY